MGLVSTRSDFSGLVGQGTLIRGLCVQGGEVLQQGNWLLGVLETPLCSRAVQGIPVFMSLNFLIPGRLILQQGVGC